MKGVYYIPELPMELIRQNEGLVYSPEFFNRLKDSILKEGIRNPIFCVSANGMFQAGPGKQRCKAATELGMTFVPALVWDRDGLVSVNKDLFRVPLFSIPEIESYFDNNHFVDANSYARGRLAVKKKVEWRNER